MINFVSNETLFLEAGSDLIVATWVKTNCQYEFDGSDIDFFVSFYLDYILFIKAFCIIPQ